MAKSRTVAPPYCPCCKKNDRMEDIDAGRTLYAKDAEGVLVDTGKPLPPAWWCNRVGCASKGGYLSFLRDLTWAGGPEFGKPVYPE